MPKIEPTRDLLSRRLLLVTGKGGVGKSAVTAGLGLVAQRRGLRVLAIEMDGTVGLSSHLGSGEFGFEPREVRPGLHAMRMVRSEALLEYLSLQLKLPGLGRFGAVARAFDALATAAPAVREIVTIGKILWEVREDKWDLVIVDSPPTGQIASYLRAPRSIAELVPAGRISSQATWMRETLADELTTAVVLVTIPEELPATETAETLDWIAETRAVGPPIVAANRVISPPPRIQGESDSVAEMAQIQKAISTEQQRWLKRVPPDVTLPYLFGLFTPSEVAAQMSDLLGALA